MARLRLLAPAFTAALLASLAAVVPAGAVDQDLTLSVPAGPARTRIEVSSASCTSDLVVAPGDEFPTGTLRLLEARLVSGVGAGEVLAAYGASGFATDGPDDPAVLVVSDWVDPALPAEVRATCTEITFDEVEDPSDEFVVTDFDPVPFDVEDPVEPVVQSATFSRTELLVGQAFAVDVAGCFVGGDATAEVALVPGGNRNPATFESLVAVGGASPDAPLRAEVLVTDADWNVEVEIDEDGEIVREGVVEQGPTIEPGTYTAFTICADRLGGDLLWFEPQLVEVTGVAPTGDLDLTVAGSDQLRLAGGSCGSSQVRYSFEAGGFEAGSEPTDPPQDLQARRRLPGVEGAGASGPLRRRALFDDLTEVASVGADGTWAVERRGPDAQVDPLVVAYAVCGDPLADGFAYDPQALLRQVETPPPPGDPEGPVGPVASPAAPIVATPRYTG